jgi:hypothetical protein
MAFALGRVAINSNRGFVHGVSPFGSHVPAISICSACWLADVAADVRRLSLFLRLTLLWSTQTALAFAVVAAVALLRTWTSPIDTMGTVFGLSLLSGLVLAVWPKKKKKKKKKAAAATVRTKTEPRRAARALSGRVPRCARTFDGATESVNRRPVAHHDPARLGGGTESRRASSRRERMGTG